jgi:20S proteasome alpha/beta subunit
LSYVDLLGTTYSAPSLATGYGNHLAQPLLRRALEKLGPDGHKHLEEADAREIVKNAMKVLFYRDARSLNKVSRDSDEREDGSLMGVVGRIVPNCDSDRARSRDLRAHVGTD